MSRKRDALETVHWAVARGWTYEGFDGRDHHLIRWTTGKPYRVPHTPSDHRSLRNVRAAIARIDGQPVEHIKRGKARHQVYDTFISTRAIPDPHGVERARILADLARCEEEFLNGDPRRDRAVLIDIGRHVHNQLRALRGCGYVNDSDIPRTFRSAWEDIA